MHNAFNLVIAKVTILLCFKFIESLLQLKKQISRVTVNSIINLFINTLTSDSSVMFFLQVCTVAMFKNFTVENGIIENRAKI